MNILVLPHELLALTIDLLDIGSVFSLGYVSKFLMVTVRKGNYHASINAILNCIIRDDHINLFKWLEESDEKLKTIMIIPIYTNNICIKAAMFGSLKILKYVYENRSMQMDSKTIIECAVKNGHLEILKYIRTKLCDNESCWDEYTCYHAIINGHLEVLKYLRENRCPWNEATCYQAVINGHMEILKYLHENGCPCYMAHCELCEMIDTKN